MSYPTLKQQIDKVITTDNTVQITGVAAGAPLVLFIGVRATLTSPPTVTDDKGSTWTTTFYTSDGGSSAVATAIAPSAGDYTITISIAEAGRKHVYAQEWQDAGGIGEVTIASSASGNTRTGGTTLVGVTGGSALSAATSTRASVTDGNQDDPSWVNVGSYDSGGTSAARLSTAAFTNVAATNGDYTFSWTTVGFNTAFGTAIVEITAGSTATGTDDQRQATIPAAYELSQAQRSAAITGRDQSAETRSAILRGATIFGGVTTPQFAVSNILTEPGSRRIADVIIYPKEVETPGDSYIEYEITTNGANWEPIQPETLYTVQNPGSNLRWRIVLHASSDGKSTPSVGYISTVWTVIPSDPADDQRGATLHGYIEHFLAFDDQAAAADTIIKSNKPGTISDQAAAGDATRKASEKPASDSAAAIEAASRSVRTPKTDSATAADSATRQAGKRASDTVQATDASRRSSTKRLQEAVTAQDQPAIKTVTRRIIEEIVGIADAVRRFFAKPSTDEAPATDESSRSIGRPEADQTGASDHTIKGITKSQSETITVNDLIGRSFIKALIEQITANDEIAKALTTGTADTIITIDDVRIAAAKILGDSVTLTDEAIETIRTVALRNLEARPDRGRQARSDTIKARSKR